MAKQDKRAEVVAEVVALAEELIAEQKQEKQVVESAPVALAEPTPAVATEVAETPAPTPVPSPTVDLATFARLNVQSYKDHWWLSIEKYAKQHGLKSYQVTIEKAIEVLSGWGARLK